MDVYHKILTKIFELAGGKETVEVDMKELLKREGFFPSIDSISSHLLAESWITETGRKYFVKLTHWGIAESRKSLTQAPGLGQDVVKNTNRLIAASRELAVMLEEFAGSTSPDQFKTIEKRFSDMASTLEKIKADM